MKTDKIKWQVVYKKVHKTFEGRYLSAYVHNTPIGLEYKIGEVTKAKVGGIFCLPDEKAVKDCPEGNATLMLIARGEVKAPDEGFVSDPQYTFTQLKKYWRPKRVGDFVRMCNMVFYKEVIPVMEVTKL